MIRKRKKEESIAQTLSEYVGDLLHVLVVVYVFAILVVLPLYFTNGYGKIGTDKAEFFRWLIEKMQWLVLPLLLVYIILALILGIEEYKRSGYLVGLLGTIKQYLRREISVTDGFAFLFFISILLSYAFSRYKEVAKWGTGGWFMGLIPLVSVMVSYFLISRFFRNSKWLVYLGILTSLGVFALGILNRFEIRPIEMAYASPYFLSTVGNINWYCGYQVVIFFLVPGLWYIKRFKHQLWNIVPAIYTFVGFVSLIVQGSDSGFVAILGFFAVLFWLSCVDEEELQKLLQLCFVFGLSCWAIGKVRNKFPDRMSVETVIGNYLSGEKTALYICFGTFVGWFFFWFLGKKCPLPKKIYLWIRRVFVGLVLVFVVGCITIIIVKTRNPERFPKLPENYFVISDYWGSTRGATFKAGWMCFQEGKPYQKWLGVGPDCMYRFISRTPNNPIIEYCNKIFGEVRLTNAHNEWLTILVNQGIIGFVSFVGMMISAMVRFLKVRKECPWAFACGVCLFTHTVNCMFSFQQTLNLTLLFVILGAGEAFYRNKKMEEKNESNDENTAFGVE